MHTLKRLTPVFVKDWAKSMLHRVAYLGDAYHCPVCDTSLKYFEPKKAGALRLMQEHGYIFSIFATETYNPMAHRCPHCGAVDRTRLMVKYLADTFAVMDKSRTYRFVHFAPEPQMRNWLQAQPFLDYRTADLMMPDVDDRVDITDMGGTYPDNSVDIFICSHILEHIPDDRKAIAELYRMLRPGGWGIVLTPVILTLDEDYENPAAVTEADRWKHFGQGDHVRVYSKSGLIAKLEEAGFTVHQYAQDHFGAAFFERSGINKNSVLYVVEK